MIIVLRLGHRIGRDARISTHVGLVARAFGADKIIYTGEKDEKLVKNIYNVSKKWGGRFEAEYVKKWKDVTRKYKSYTKIHLTMYGIPFEEKIKELRKKKNILIFVGGEKVPISVYKVSDYNIAVTNQPHSEVSALAIFLHEYFKGKELKKLFNNPKLMVIPKECGKEVARL